MQKRRVVAFGDSISYPPKDGISAHTIGVLWALSLSGRFDITLIVCQRSDEHLPKLIRERITVIELAPNDYYDVNVVSLHLKSILPDVVQTYSSYYARLVIFPYASRNRVPVVVEHHDIDVEHLSNYSVAGTPRWQIEATERASLNRTLSSSDASKLRAMVPHCDEKIINMPTMILPEPLDMVTNLSAEECSDVLFVGNCSYPPNLQAAEYIIGQLAPLFPRKVFHIVGRNSDMLQTPHSNVHTYGFIESLSEIARKCRIGIAPLSSGSGLKIKVLTYLSLGLVVVGTKKAFAGFEPSSYLIPTSLSAFANTINGVFSQQNPPDKSVVVDYFNSTYHNNRDVDGLCNLYENIQYKEHLTDTNSTTVVADSRFIPFLSESR